MVVQRIEVDAVIGGATMKITLGAGCPSRRVALLWGRWTPTRQARTISSKSFGEAGALRARLLVITLPGTDTRPVYRSGGRGERTVDVAVSKKKARVPRPDRRVRKASLGAPGDIGHRHMSAVRHRELVATGCGWILDDGRREGVSRRCAGGGSGGIDRIYKD